VSFTCLPSPEKSEVTEQTSANEPRQEMRQRNMHSTSALFSSDRILGSTVSQASCGAPLPCFLSWCSGAFGRSRRGYFIPNRKHPHFHLDIHSTGCLALPDGERLQLHVKIRLFCWIDICPACTADFLQRTLHTPHSVHTLLGSGHSCHDLPL